MIVKCKHINVYEHDVKVSGDGGGSDSYCPLKWCRDCGALKLRGGKWQYPKTRPPRNKT